MDPCPSLSHSPSHLQANGHRVAGKCALQCHAQLECTLADERLGQKAPLDGSLVTLCVTGEGRDVRVKSKVRMDLSEE